MAASSLFRPKLRRRLPRSTSAFYAGAAASTTSSLIARRSVHEGPDTVEELLERHLVKKSPRDGEEDELDARRRLTSTRREVLGLYRDIIRATRFFTWPDARGVPWRDVLRENARREFEEARFERDPEVVTRLLIGGRDAVQKALDKLVEASKKAMAEEEEQRRGGR